MGSFELLTEWHVHVREHSWKKKVAAMMRGEAVKRVNDGGVRISGEAIELSGG